MIINGRVSKAKSMNGRRLPILELQLSEILPTVIPETTSTSKAIDITHIGVLLLLSNLLI